MLGWCLQAASDEPDLVSAARNTWVLVHGNHVAVSLELVDHAQNLPEQAYLPAHRLLCGCPKEGPDGQSENTASSAHIGESVT